MIAGGIRGRLRLTGAPVVVLALIGSSGEAPGASRPGPEAFPSVVVTVAFPQGRVGAIALVDPVLLGLERAIQDAPGLRSTAVAMNPGWAEIIVGFERGVDREAAVKAVQDRVRAAEDALSGKIEPQGIRILPAVARDLLYVSVGDGDGEHDQGFLYDYASEDLLRAMKGVRGVEGVTVFGHRRRVLRLKLDLEKLRGRDLSAQDISKALEGCSLVDSSGVIRPTEPFVRKTEGTRQTLDFFGFGVSRHEKPKRYGDIILSANPEGEVLRLSELAEVEFAPMYPNYSGLYSALDLHPSAGVILRVEPGAEAAVVAEVPRKLAELKGSPSSSGLTIEFGDEPPASWRLPLDRPSPEPR